MASDKTTRATAVISGALAVLEVTGDVTHGSGQAIQEACGRLHSKGIKRLLPNFHPSSTT